MKNFNRGGGFGGGRDSGRRGGFGGGNRDGGRPQMHHAVCADCGNDCEVPFRPSGDKPVYCNDCFEKKGNAGSRRNESRSFDRPNFRDKQMFSATCAKCGKRCEVPFRPTEGKPVYCNDCFVKPGMTADKNTGSKNADQLAAINTKLDKIMKALGLEANLPKKQEKIKEAKKPAVKKITTKKKSKKK